MIRVYLILVVAVLVRAANAQEQSSTTAPNMNIWRWPPIAGICDQGFATLRGEVERSGQLLRMALDKHADKTVICDLFEKFGAAQSRMMVYVRTRSPDCAISSNALNPSNISYADTERTRALCTAPDEPPRLFSIKQYEPRKSKLIGDWPPMKR
jgi:hypothetical protein